MATPPATPRTKTSFDITTPTTRRVSNTNVVQSSPHYATTRRHSLYGVEDRVVIDPGSRIWKVGFSGEGRPRDVFLADTKSGTSLWGLQRVTKLTERVEEEKLLEVKLQRCLRSVFHDSLLTDPKARKVILVENPLVPVHIKDILVRILFENYVPSISFASSHLLSLLTVGRITGLVLDCGHLESVALPIFAARPLYSNLRSTPLAGCRLSSHLRALLLLFGTYVPPPTSLSTAISIPSTNRSTRIPQEVLTDLLVEEIKTRFCFVGESLRAVETANDFSVNEPETGSEFDVPLSEATHSESSTSHAGRESSVSSDFSVVSSFHRPGSDTHSSKDGHLQALANLYMRHSTATDLRMPVVPPVSQQTGTGRGTIIIPGWIRERAAEVLFEGGDIDEGSLAEVILDALLKVPVDLRKTLVSSILISGGTAMLPGFIPRLHSELLQLLYPPAAKSDHPESLPGRKGGSTLPRYDRFGCLCPLLQYLAILNNPVPPAPLSDRAKANAGRAPAFTPATLAWVGGSLAGALKIGGAEVARERWDEVTLQTLQDQGEAGGTEPFPESERLEAARNHIIPDWTRAVLCPGAPPANINEGTAARLPVQAEVGA